MRTTFAYVLEIDGNLLRFVLGEGCPCATLDLATFFPDHESASQTARAYPDGSISVLKVEIAVIKKLAVLKKQQ